MAIVEGVRRERERGIENREDEGTYGRNRRFRRESGENM